MDDLPVRRRLTFWLRRRWVLRRPPSNPCCGGGPPSHVGRFDQTPLAVALALDAAELTLDAA
jgi:hypothetical protein